MVPLIFGAIPIIGFTYSLFKNTKKELTEFNKSPISLSITLIFMLSLFGSVCYKYFFDNKIKLEINRNGFWTPKSGHINWQSVWYIYQKEIRGKAIDQTLVIRLNEDDKEIKLETTYFVKTAEEIIGAVKEYSQKFDIQFLDKEIQRTY